jgi:hypothetical protein
MIRMVSSVSFRPWGSRRGFDEVAGRATERLCPELDLSLR